MLYDAVCHANLQSVICYPYPISIRGIVENDIHIYPYPQKIHGYPKISIRGPISVHLCTNDGIKDVTEKYWMTHPVFMSHVWLSTNGVIHCKSYNLQVGAKSPLTGQNDQWVGEMSSEGVKRPGSETSQWRNVHKPLQQHSPLAIIIVTRSAIYPKTIIKVIVQDQVHIYGDTVTTIIFFNTTWKLYLN